MFVNTGDYIEHKNNTPMRSTYYTFTPRPLMDGGFFTMDNDLASLLTTAYRNIGVLEGLLLTVDEKEMLEELMLLKESFFNKKIDYPDFNIYSFMLNRGLGKTDDEINNVASACLRILDDKANKINFDDIARCALHGSNSKQKAHTRNSQIFLSKSISNYRQYNPTAPRDIHSAMQDIDRYVELDGIDVLIKTAMCHYQFEIIHPYESYNGIIGRLFIYKMLHNAGLKAVRYISLSECFYNRKAEYFEKLGLTQKSGSYTSWIEFFIRIIYEAAKSGISSTQTYINIIRSDEEKLVGSKSSLRHLHSVYDHFTKNVVSTVSQTSSQLQLTFNAASRAIEVLQSLGILAQVTEQSRNRLFAHAGLMRLFLSEQE